MMDGIDILMKKLAKENFKFALQISCLVGIGILGVGLLMTSRERRDVSYYATFENGDTVRVDSIIAVPISSTEQISRMWPAYYAETTINIEGKEILLRSEPFLFCDNPEMEGRYADRNVYCPD